MTDSVRSLVRACVVGHHFDQDAPPRTTTLLRSSLLTQAPRSSFVAPIDEKFAIPPCPDPWRIFCTNEGFIPQTIKLILKEKGSGQSKASNRLVDSQQVDSIRSLLIGY